MTNNLLEVSHLKTSFATEGGHITAVDDVSFSMKRGEVLGIVGESGCGKSVTAFSIMRLFNDGGTSVEGAIHFNNKNLIDLSEKELEQIRGSQISMIFQDPMSSLNPVFTIGDQIMEPLIIHQKMNRKEARVKALEMLKLVGIAAPETRFNEYPYQLSGGMRQRVMIAISLSCNPQLLIADEPTTALDVTIQAQILDLMMHLKKRLDMGIIMITHDLGVVAETCNKVAIMYLGEIVEELDVETLFEAPKHPYTIGLLQSMPSLDTDRRRKLEAIEGTVPSLTNVPKGCRFAARCKYAETKCYDNHPSLEMIDENHKIRCWLHGKIDFKL
jgi:oligopeptide/dipeptide ABC transporter ATP-binding protein